MPPWAPEMLVNATPAAKRALEERMKEARLRFIAARDAAKKGSYDQARDHMQQDSDHDESAPEIKQSAHVAEAPEEPKSSASDQVDTASDFLDDVPLDPGPPLHSSREHSTESESEPEPEPVPDANSDSYARPPALVRDQFEDFAQADTVNRVADQQLPSPLLTESPAIDSLPTPIVPPSEEPCVPLRKISLRDADSDLDSFHTAEGDDNRNASPHRSADALLNDLALPPQLDVAEVEWQAFQDNTTLLAPTTTQDPTNAEAANGHTSHASDYHQHTPFYVSQPDPNSPVRSPRASKPEQNLRTFSSENLEDSVAISHAFVRNNVQQNPPFGNFATSAEFSSVRSEEIPLDNSPRVQTQCQDCERWRERVQELELKVEALTSALTAREMEAVALRAKTTPRGRHVPRNEAQLIQECQSLRVTTEFLVSLSHVRAQVKTTAPVVLCSVF